MHTQKRSASSALASKVFLTPVTPDLDSGNVKAFFNSPSLGKRHATERAAQNPKPAKSSNLSGVSLAARDFENEFEKEVDKENMSPELAFPHDGIEADTEAHHYIYGFDVAIGDVHLNDPLDEVPPEDSDSEDGGHDEPFLVLEGNNDSDELMRQFLNGNVPLVVPSFISRNLDSESVAEESQSEEDEKLLKDASFHLQQRWISFYKRKKARMLQASKSLSKRSTSKIKRCLSRRFITHLKTQIKSREILKTVLTSLRLEEGML